MNRNPIILSTGSYVPGRIITNAEIDEILGISTDQWLIENVGIRERRWMADGQVTSDLIVEACKAALARASVRPEDLDLIIVSTDTPDYLSPSTSIVVQHKLGADKAGCYDVNSACAGWVTALDQGARYLLTETDFKYVLVAGGYGMSKYLDLADKTTANLFADGAGAALLGIGDNPGFLASNLLAKGEFHDALGIYSGGTFSPATIDNLQPYGKPVVKFVKKFPKTFNTDHWPNLIQGALDKVDLSFDDVDHYYLTQLNLRTIEAMMELMGQSINKTHWVMDKWGYTGSPCVIMALDDAIANGKGPQPGDIIAFCASRGGISMASSVWKWST
jgi:3-oxoacyl-[acyl-carrier-protein] synthase-3